MKENVKSSIAIGGKLYPMLVTKEEEILLKQVEKKINDAYLFIQKEYAVNDKIDSLAMTMIKILFEEASLPSNVDTQADLTINNIVTQIEQTLAQVESK